MKFVDYLGVETMVEPMPEDVLPSPYDPDAVPECRLAVVGALIAKGYSQAQVAEIMKVSIRTVKRRWRAVRPGLKIPKLAPVFGADPDWRPEVEDWRSVAEICPRCGSEEGPIQPGAQLFCAACGRSGFDDQVEADREADRQVEARREAARKAEAARRKAERAARLARRSG